MLRRRTCRPDEFVIASPDHARFNGGASILWRACAERWRRPLAWRLFGGHFDVLSRDQPGSPDMHSLRSRSVRING